MVVSSVGTFSRTSLAAIAPTNTLMIENDSDSSRPSPSLAERWEAVSQPGSEQTEMLFSEFLRKGGNRSKILNCAISKARALELTRFSFPQGVSASDCLTTSGTGIFPRALENWTYEPRIRAVRQLPQMQKLPVGFSSLGRLPWFQCATPSAWLGINARHLRYNWDFWQELKPKKLQGVFTTLILGMPQIAFTFTPHIQLENSFLFLGALARGFGPVQLFPARYLYPDANVRELATAPAPIFADILPATGGFSYPVVDCEPDPWRVLARFGRCDRYYGYPFHAVVDPMKDFILHNHERGVMLLPTACRVTARQSESRVLATLDPDLNQDLLLDLDAFSAKRALLRGTVTHDGLPFNLPIEVQAMILAVVLTHWSMELDHPGELGYYTIATQHAAIRGYNYSQRVEPYYSNFMRLVQDISRDPNFRSYPLSTHLTESWLGGNLQISNQISRSERELGPNVMRAFNHQQFAFQMGVANLANHVAFRSRKVGSTPVSATGAEIEGLFDREALAFHQMHRMLRFDSHLFPRPSLAASHWPSLDPGFLELDRELRTETLPKL